MDFEAGLRSLAEKIEKTKDSVQTEEATKTSYVFPMLQLLGYDVFDPNVVVPEFTADIGRKKKEKVDFAIMKDGKPIILLEVKPHTQSLDRHKTQLERYYTVTDAKFAILTNGIDWWFYSDIDETNRMDEHPFLSINLLDLRPRDIRELEKFKADNFNIESILDLAEERKQINSIKEIFIQETKDPSDEFVRFFASQLTKKPLRQNVIKEFRRYVQRAFKEITDDLLMDRFKSIKASIVQSEQEAQVDEQQNEIVTTEEELEGFYIVKSILAEVVPLERIVARDTKSYFGILLDDNNRKWIARLHFNRSNKYLGIHTEDKKEEKFLLSRLEDIYKYKDKLQNAVKRLDK